MGAISILYFVAATPIMQAFSDDPEVISSGANALRALALSQPLWGLLFVYAGALRGTGNTRFPLIVNSVWVWAVVGLAWLAIVVLDRGLAFAWLAFTIVSPFAILAFWWRIRRDPHLGHHLGELEVIGGRESNQRAA